MSRHSNARGVRKDQSAGMPRDPATGDGAAVGGVAASLWNNVGAGIAIGGMAAALFLDKPPGAWTKIGIPRARQLVAELFEDFSFDPLFGCFPFVNLAAKQTPVIRERRGVLGTMLK